jgi:hypothetical protein
MSQPPDAASGFVFVGHSDQGGRSDGTQVMVSRGHAYIGHPFSHGFSIIDVGDPRCPETVGFVPCSPGTWTLGVQAHDHLLLVTEEFDFFSLTDEQSTHFGASTKHGGSGMQSTHPVYGGRGEAFTAGLRIYDISEPAHPRPIGFCSVDGFGLHRAWWPGDRYVYASASLDGFTDHVLVVIDVADPTAPTVVGRFWMPGQWLAGGEQPTWNHRVALHHGLTADGLLYSSWRDHGLAVIDVADPSAPALVSRLTWSPPFGGNTHTSLPLPDRGLVIVADEAAAEVGQEQQKRTWIVDVRDRRFPTSIGSLPTPSDQDYLAKGGQFGPHNLWENRPEGWVSSDTIFATYQSAGVRVFDIRDQFQPREVGYYVPRGPERMIDPRAGIAPVVHSSDLFVATDGLVYVIDYNIGLTIVQWNGN